MLQVASMLENSVLFYLLRRLKLFDLFYYFVVTDYDTTCTLIRVRVRMLSDMYVHVCMSC